MTILDDAIAVLLASYCADDVLVAIRRQLDNTHVPLEHTEPALRGKLATALDRMLREHCPESIVEVTPESKAPYPWCTGYPTIAECIRVGYCRRKPGCGD